MSTKSVQLERTYFKPFQQSGHWSPFWGPPEITRRWTRRRTSTTSSRKRSRQNFPSIF